MVGVQYSTVMGASDNNNNDTAVVLLSFLATSNMSNMQYDDAFVEVSRSAADSVTRGTCIS
jgi:hypothetical protein